ncbi:uncharacterized protein [Pyrus communis]|uniref:uncharacterized protein n=1 Tax=Pyrus communis TaxID=23211 RepID=UPI0035C24302
MVIQYDSSPPHTKPKTKPDPESLWTSSSKRPSSSPQNPKTPTAKLKPKTTKKSLRDLEEEVRSLRAENKAKKREPKSDSEGEVSLYAVFTNKKPADGGGRKRKEVTRERSNELKDLSQDMEVVASHLFKEGYFKDANFLFVNGDRLDFSCFNNSYGCSFIRFTVESFARDNQAIAKWLSGSDLKKVALLGCPSPARKSDIPEDKVSNYPIILSLPQYISAQLIVVLCFSSPSGLQ